ncbi:unnamed protein product, partial [Parnassius mnemosyne]
MFIITFLLTDDRPKNVPLTYSEITTIDSELAVSTVKPIQNTVVTDFDYDAFTNTEMTTAETYTSTDFTTTQNVKHTTSFPSESKNTVDNVHKDNTNESFNNASSTLLDSSDEDKTIVTSSLSTTSMTYHFTDTHYETRTASENSNPDMFDNKMEQDDLITTSKDKSYTMQGITRSDTTMDDLTLSTSTVEAVTKSTNNLVAEDTTPGISFYTEFNNQYQSTLDSDELVQSSSTINSESTVKPFSSRTETNGTTKYSNDNKLYKTPENQRKLNNNYTHVTSIPEFIKQNEIIDQVSTTTTMPNKTKTNNGIYNGLFVSTDNSKSDNDITTSSLFLNATETNIELDTSSLVTIYKDFSDNGSMKPLENEHLVTKPTYESTTTLILNEGETNDNIFTESTLVNDQIKNTFSEAILKPATEESSQTINTENTVRVITTSKSLDVKYTDTTDFPDNLETSTSSRNYMESNTLRSYIFTTNFQTDGQEVKKYDITTITSTPFEPDII